MTVPPLLLALLPAPQVHQVLRAQKMKEKRERKRELTKLFSEARKNLKMKSFSWALKLQLQFRKGEQSIMRTKIERR